MLRALWDRTAQNMVQNSLPQIINDNYHMLVEVAEFWDDASKL